MTKILTVILAIILANRIAWSASSLTFGTATTDVVNHGSQSVVDDLDPFTWLAWIYPTSWAVNRILIRKGAAVTGRKVIFMNTSLGQLQVNVDRVTTDTDYTTNQIISLNNWWRVGLVFNSQGSVNNIANIYYAIGSTAPIREATYQGITDGAGAIDSDAPNPLTVGNRDGSVGAFPGQIAWVGIYKGALTPAEMAEQFIVPSSTMLVFSAYYGRGSSDTALVQDLTGNGSIGVAAGTVGSSNGPPLTFFGGNR